MVKVPTTLLCTNGSGWASALSTWVSAAKCTTASASPTNLSTSPPSVMSPCTSRISLSTGASDSRLPAYVNASSTVTESSGCSRTHPCTKFAPINPAPPVTSNRMLKP